MGVPTSEVGYTSATTGRGDREGHKGHVVALGGGLADWFCMTQLESVYCAAQTESLYKADMFFLQMATAKYSRGTPTRELRVGFDIQ
jgi:hypothetical protein